LQLVEFVDQEDTMSILAVYDTDTCHYSVFGAVTQRLPEDMSIKAKKFTTLKMMNELDILRIKDSRIKDTGACYYHPCLLVD
jgi:hypothetical protein